MSSREFNRDRAVAKRAALNGPVVITNRGKPAHVLLSYHHYQLLVGGGRSIVDLLRSPTTAEIDLDPKRDDGTPRRVNLG